MPFKSEAQRRYLWAKRPDIARRWADEEEGKKRRALRRIVKRGKRNATSH